MTDETTTRSGVVLEWLAHERAHLYHAFAGASTRALCGVPRASCEPILTWCSDPSTDTMTCLHCQARAFPTRR